MHKFSKSVAICCQGVITQAGVGGLIPSSLYLFYFAAGDENFWLITSYVKKVAFLAINLGAIKTQICIKMIKV